MKRPASITVFGILHLIFAGLGLLGMLFAPLVLFMEDNGTNPTVTAINEIGWYRAYMFVSIPLGFIVMAILLAAGIGLLGNKPWSRLLSNIYGVYAILGTIVGGVINFIVLVAPVLENRSGGVMTPEEAGAIGGVIGSLAGLIYPICVLIFLNRASVKAWLAADNAPVQAEPDNPW